MPEVFVSKRYQSGMFIWNLMNKIEKGQEDRE